MLLFIKACVLSLALVGASSVNSPPDTLTEHPVDTSDVHFVALNVVPGKSSPNKNVSSKLLPPLADESP